ncbi:scavenger receptor class F member 1 [Lampris incognitus]|uniref:scavenger receptor class F member 1 n=1 Tax=Lampris incognitus TaxID=2546036 RepID=UPI0024B4AF5C|nr:scavenger receptor class F member 1 [Lampris incognitus]
MGPLLRSLIFLLCLSLCTTQTLDLNGNNVCWDLRNPSTLVCCIGWQQEGKECTIPVCEGEHACQGDEICVYPGVCRCPPGYYGPHCKTRCPPEFWAPNCRKLCQCYPHGRCHPVTGECTCNPNRWGPLCQHTCKCARYGHCHPIHGNCTCDEGWWTPTCAKPCQCFNGGAVGAACDQVTGRCRCHQGYWGQKCLMTCNCYLSPCHQWTGVCECQGGWWGPNCDRRCNCDLAHSHCDPVDGQCLCQSGYKSTFCNQKCEAGKYGSGCMMSCGHCKDGHPCATTDGGCVACKPGWDGPRCDRLCPSGYFGEGCQEKCPQCRNGESCDPITGNCRWCDPGWTGTSCNSSCPTPQYGLNCSSVCDCGEGVSCHPIDGICNSSGHGALLAGVLVPLLLVFLAVLCCCLCCGEGPAEGKDRGTMSDGSTSARIKYHVYNVMANVGAALPCTSVWSSGLPRVTVSHHDPELTFNHSFIEPPSSGWMTEGSSFDSDEEEGEALYCVPPREDIPAVAGGEFQEMASKCNMFLDPSGFSGEDIALSFSIPRTSSIAKSKRPSVSFAEGTRFSPKEQRGSAQDLGAPPGPSRTKTKSSWGVLMLSALQAQGGMGRSGEEDRAETEEREKEVEGKGEDNQETSSETGEHGADRTLTTPSNITLQVPGSSGRRHTMSNTTSQKGAQVPASTPDAQVGVTEKVTTVYVTVGRAGRPTSKVENPSEGPVQAMLRRLGSLQRQKEKETWRPIAKADGIIKPPRRKLGARASMWEQGEPSGGGVSISKPSRKKHTSLNSPSIMGSNDSPQSEHGTEKRPLSSILKNTPKAVYSSSESGLEMKAEEARFQSGTANIGQTESNTPTVGPAAEAGSFTEVIANEGVEFTVNDEPNYENILINHS